MTIKTSELTGAALDWAAAKCEGFPARDYCPHDKYYRDSDNKWFCPSEDWAHGGPIIEREKLGVWYSEAVHDENGKVLREACWYCETSCTTDNGDAPYKCEIGETPLIAAMRCYVASKLGDEIEIPDELKE